MYILFVHYAYIIYILFVYIPSSTCIMYILFVQSKNMHHVYSFFVHSFKDMYIFFLYIPSSKYLMYIFLKCYMQYNINAHFICNFLYSLCTSILHCAVYFLQRNTKQHSFGLLFYFFLISLLRQDNHLPLLNIP